MKLFKTIAIIFAGLIVLFFIVGVFLPSQWQVQRSEVIAASPEAIYQYVGNLKKWREWTVWNNEQDPTMQHTYEGPEMGVGSQNSWTSEKMGIGWLRIIQADPETGISYTLFIDMGRFRSTIAGQIAFVRQPNGTLVTWTDQGDNGTNIVKKWMSLMIDSMLGKELDKNLANLKLLVEPKTAL